MVRLAEAKTQAEEKAQMHYATNLEYFCYEVSTLRLLGNFVFLH